MMADLTTMQMCRNALDREHQAWLRGETVGRTQEAVKQREHWWQ